MNTRHIKARARWKARQKMYRVAGISSVVEPPDFYDEPEMKIVEEVRQVILVEEIPTFAKVFWLDAVEVALMETTGLEDKHGKDIYEGDIVVLTDRRRNKRETHQVYYDTSKACFGPFHHFIDGGEERWIDVDYEVEIIGTIYEQAQEG